MKCRNKIGKFTGLWCHKDVDGRLMSDLGLYLRLRHNWDFY